MITRHSSQGTTLIELLFALTLLALLLGLAYAPVGRKLDAFAVRSARESLAAGVARARAAAVAHGGATLLVDVASARFWVEASGDTVGRPVSLTRRYGVTIGDAAAGTVALRFDGRGLGRLANHTFRIRRGDAESGLTLSTYGRPRRW